MTSLYPHDLRGVLNVGPGLAEQRDQFRQAALDYAADLFEARESLRRIDRVLTLMRDTYAEHGDTRAVGLIDAIRRAVVTPELPDAPEPVPAGVEMVATGIRHPQDGGAR